LCIIIYFRSWFYSTENLFFSLVLPKGQEAELTGFFVYCTQILVWLPPLVFSGMIQRGLPMHWGLVSITIFLAISVALLCCVAPWEDVLKESKGGEENYEDEEKKYHLDESPTPCFNGNSIESTK